MTTKIVCVVPSIRPDSMKEFKEAWKTLFEKHNVTLITVWDGENPKIERYSEDYGMEGYFPLSCHPWKGNRGLFCRFTDACRNLGFVAAAQLQPDYVLTLDDDCYPLPATDPILDHIDALDKRVSITWMNTAHDTELYLRGVPYGVRDESPVMLSHGVWVGTPDFDGETQLGLEDVGDRLPAKNNVPYSLPYYVGPVPRGIMFPICGMSVMVKKEALPYLYFAPMGRDTKIEGLNRFADIWMGILLKREFDRLGWAIYTGTSTILHTRASDARKNFEQEKLGRKWNEWMTNTQYAIKEEDSKEFNRFQTYMRSYYDKANRYAQLISNILKGDK